MLSKVIKEKLNQRFSQGQGVRYPKDCDSLASHISQACKTQISGSTLRRLFGFVKGVHEPRQYTLDILAEYLGYKSWQLLLNSFEKEEMRGEKIIERLSSQQVKTAQVLMIKYEPKKVVELKKRGNGFHVVSSNEKKLLLNDEVKFTLLELHYPLTFTHVIRQGSSIGRLQVTTVSGIICIEKR